MELTELTERLEPYRGMKLLRLGAGEIERLQNDYAADEWHRAEVAAQPYLEDGVIAVFAGIAIAEREPGWLQASQQEEALKRFARVLGESASYPSRIVN